MKMILTAVGRDQPGIVAGVSKVLFETGCNIEDSSMTQLGGEFAMMLLVSLKEEVSPDAVLKALKAVEQKMKLLFSLRPLEKSSASEAQEGRPNYVLSVYGADHPGIVYGVTDLLANRNVNIADVSTQMVGEKDKPVYCMLLEVRLSDATDPEALKKALQDKAKSLNVDISFRPVESVEL